MKIRLLTPDDINAFLDIRLAALQTNPEAFGSSYEEEVMREPDFWQQRLEEMTASGVSFVLGAWDGEELVGMMGFMRSSRLKQRHRGDIWGVFVRSDYRRQGLGRRLMRALLERVRTQSDLLQIQLSVNSSNPAALTLYESFGFTAYGVEPNALFVNGRYYDETHMVLHL